MLLQTFSFLPPIASGSLGLSGTVWSDRIHGAIRLPRDQGEQTPGASAPALRECGSNLLRMTDTDCVRGRWGIHRKVLGGFCLCYRTWTLSSVHLLNPSVLLLRHENSVYQGLCPSILMLAREELGTHTASFPIQDQI